VSLRSSPYSTADAEIPGAKSPADLRESTRFVLFGKGVDIQLLVKEEMYFVLVLFGI
jgi:hypothetical protein